MSRPPASVAIMAERTRQIKEEGFTAEIDDEHTRFELAFAAAAYCLGAVGKQKLANQIWPKKFDGMFKPNAERRRDLVRAGALIIAEIERIDRKENPK